jgi:hypothetical protein
MSSSETSLFDFNKSDNSATSQISALVKALEGPDYSYIKAMATPGELGAGIKAGDVNADLNAINDYVNVLISGKGPARVGDSNQPIGDRYFLNTGAKCKGVTIEGDCAKKKSGCPVVAEGDAGLVPRFTVINNIPSGKSSIFPTKLSSTGTAFDSFEGIIPGIVSDVMDFDPAAMFSAFLLPPYPQCAEVDVQVNTGAGVKGGTDYNFESVKRYVILSDIDRQDPCIFTSKENPVSGEKCKEGFANFKDLHKHHAPSKAIIPKDPSVRLYLLLISLLGSYLLFKMLFRSKN